MEKHDIDYREETFLVPLFGNFHSYDSDASIKIDDFLANCSSKVWLSIETLLEAIKAAVSEKL